MRILHQRVEQQIERFARLSLRRQVTGQRQPGAPVLRVLVDQPPAQRGKALGVAELRVGASSRANAR